TEGASERRLVLEGRADDARGGILGGGDRRRSLFDAHGLGGAAARDFIVVGVAAVGSHPVVGARGRRRRAGRRAVVPVATHRHRAIGGDRASFAFAVVVQLPADRPARLGAEQTAQRGLVLERRTDDA